MGILVVRFTLRSLCIFNAIILVCCVSSNDTDMHALLAFKAQIKEDPYGAMSSWNESTNFCIWHGVTCSRRHHQRVTMLDLPSQNLVGSLSPHVGNLSFLRILNLDNNSLSHEIPPGIGHLHRLQVLRLHNNSFSGPIPSNISHCFNLEYVNLGYNKLVGNIPSEIGSFPKLYILVFQHNNLTGEIPPSLGNLSYLEVFAASDNNFKGNIPSSLGQLKKLTFLTLGVNYLSGTFPPSLCNISSLQTLMMQFNQIEGSVPSYCGKYLPNLEAFSIAENQFTGSIPLSISNATSLWMFQFGYNKLTGQVPDLRKLHNLKDFNIQGNRLGSGRDGDLSFLSDLTNARELRKLVMTNNNFGGSLPTSISNLSTKLEFFLVQKNRIDGSIPAGLGNLISMEALAMYENSLTGNIPTDIGKLANLVEFDVSMNKLSGSIPSSLGDLTKLSRLYLEGNYLQGFIPSSLGECHGLQLLDLSYNNLNGTIPEKVFGLRSLSIYLDLSNNYFTGSLPTEVGNLGTLSRLDISGNRLSGELPNSLGSCVSLGVLHLQGNFFNGSIPSSMTSLRGIQDLDLSRNNLSGEIPKFLEDFFSLKNLNLSFNGFWGSVPIGGVFGNASATSIVGNTRLCGGIGKLQLPKCKSKRGGSSRSLKLIIPLVSGLALLGIAMVLSYFFLCSSRKKTKEISLSTLAKSILQMSYNTLSKATDGFSSTNLIGMGSFGSVYKGVLAYDDIADQLVAVKVFNLSRRGAFKSFIAESESLRNIRHRNLVKIITACSSVDFRGNDFKALVYQFMDNGSLEEWLHPTTGEVVRDHAPKNLNLLQRLDIVIHVACALDYLHNHCETPIVHCDLKPSNVLLDNELIGHVSDFGLARILSQISNNDISANQISSIGIRGTVGYAAPEYGMGSEVSINGDVYSFGILVLEMFTGKRPTDNMFSGDLNLHNFVKMSFPDRVGEIAESSFFQGGTDETPDQYRVRVQKFEVCLSSIFRIGIECSAESPTDRLKNISDVVSDMYSVRNILIG